MITKTVTYENFKGDLVSKELHFHLSEPELMDMEAEEEGLADKIREVIANDDANEKYLLFKKIVLAAYGEVSEDGDEFIKSKELTDKFQRSAAYGAFFMDLVNSDETTVSNFFTGIFPAQLIEKGRQIQAEQPERFGTLASIVNKEN